MLTVSGPTTRLDAKVQFAHLDALEQFRKVVTDKKGTGSDELRRSFWAGPETRSLEMGIGAAGIERGEKNLPRKLGSRPPHLHYR
jgi:hypothetical protein